MIQTKKEYTQKAYNDVIRGYQKEIEFAHDVVIEMKREIDILKQTIQDRDEMIKKLRCNVEDWILEEIDAVIINIKDKGE